MRQPKVSKKLSSYSGGWHEEQEARRGDVPRNMQGARDGRASYQQPLEVDGGSEMKKSAWYNVDFMTARRKSPKECRDCPHWSFTAEHDAGTGYHYTMPICTAVPYEEAFCDDWLYSEFCIEKECKENEDGYEGSQDAQTTNNEGDSQDGAAAPV